MKTNLSFTARGASRQFLGSAIAALSVVGVMISPAHANLLEQGSFDVFAKGKFEGWHVPRADAGGLFSHGLIRHDGEVFVGDAGYSMALQFHGEEKDGEEEITFRVRPSDLIAVSPESKYELTFSAKADGGPFLVTVEAHIVDANGKKKNVKPLQFAVPAEWQKKSLTIDVPAGGLHLGFMLKIVKGRGVAGTLWLDEFSVEQVP